MNDPLTKRLVRNLLFILPVFIIFSLGYIPMNAATMDIWATTVILAFVTAVPFYLDMLWLVRGKRFLPEWKPRRFKANESGVIWVWVTAALTLGTVAIVWWVISYPLFLIIDTYSEVFTTPEEIAPLLSLLTRVIVWFLGVVVFGIIIWALVSSYQGERQSYPVNPYYG